MKNKINHFVPVPTKFTFSPSRTRETRARIDLIFESTSKCLSLEWENISITDENKDKIAVNILTNVSGFVKSGETLAMLGASGAGKTTLLNHLSRKFDYNSFKTSGKILLNKQELSKEDFTSIISYVMQDDALDPDLTPKEILFFTAKLRCNQPQQVIELKVSEVLKLLKLENCQNTRIGDNLSRGISGGERKRVSIAIELLSDLPIIFLDEPTSGLDSCNAYSVIKAINMVAREKKKIVIFTIHQPASEIYELIDKFCILAKGKTVFFGEKSNLIPYFNHIELPIPYSYNPFEYIIEMTTLTSIDDARVIEKYPILDKISDRQERYSLYISTISDSFNNKFKEINTCDADEISLETRLLMYSSKHRSGFCYQLYNLILKQIIITMRNKKIFFSYIAQLCVVGLLIAIVFYNSDQSYIGNKNRLGVFFVLCSYGIFSALNIAILICMCIIYIYLYIVCEERSVFVRERSDFLYSPLAYYISKIISLIPISCVTQCLLSCIIYYSVNLNSTYAYKFWMFTLILNVCYICANIYAVFLASLSKNQQMLITINLVSR